MRIEPWSRLHPALSRGARRALVLAATCLPWTHAGAEMRWVEAQSLLVEGRPFEARAAAYDRLPGDYAERVRPELWQRAHDSAGIAVRFVTDATHVEARWTLLREALALPHMAATGVSGLDLYARPAFDVSPGETVSPAPDSWRWVGNGRPSGLVNQATLADGLAAAGEREFLLYLPLYNGVASLEIGVPEEAALRPGPGRDTLPLVFYGTSITQGACASRPGRCHVALLGRWLDRETVNLGFSGEGTLDLPLAEACAAIEAAVYVVDCLPNLTPGEVALRTRPFVLALRRARPDTPIVLVEDRTLGAADLVPARAAEQAARRAALRAAWNALVEAGDQHVFYVSGDDLLGQDGDATVDGSHPSDLGFERQARALLPLLQELVAR